MKNNPGRTARLWIHKIRIFWWFDSGPVATGSGIGRFLPFLMVAKGFLLLFSIGGFYLLLRERPGLAFLGLIVCAVMTFVFMVFFSGRIRYFTPLEPVLMIAAGYFLTILLSRVKGVSSLAEKI